MRMIHSVVIRETPPSKRPRKQSRSFKQKLKDEYLQNWRSVVEKSSSGQNYRIFENKFEINDYFTYLPT